jgi:hypothetical protein
MADDEEVDYAEDSGEPQPRECGGEGGSEAGDGGGAMSKK